VEHVCSHSTWSWGPAEPEGQAPIRAGLSVDCGSVAAQEVAVPVGPGSHAAPEAGVPAGCGSGTAQETGVPVGHGSVMVV
jgi:hypothetical protein